MAAIEVSAMSIADFMERYNHEGPFEFVDGEIIPAAPQVARSGRVGGRFFRKLAGYVENHDLGEVFIETPFVLTLDNPNWVKGSRVSDVMFYSKEKLAALEQAVPDWEDKPLIGVPDFVAEVISPTDKFTEVSLKVTRYLQDGVRLLWIINPQQKMVTVYTSGSDQQTIVSDLNSSLNGGDVIPGFSIKLADLF